MKFLYDNKYDYYIKHQREEIKHERYLISQQLFACMDKVKAIKTDNLLYIAVITVPLLIGLVFAGLSFVGGGGIVTIISVPILFVMLGILVLFAIPAVYKLIVNSCILFLNNRNGSAKIFGQYIHMYTYHSEIALCNAALDKLKTYDLMLDELQKKVEYEEEIEDEFFHQIQKMDLNFQIKRAEMKDVLMEKLGSKKYLFFLAVIFFIAMMGLFFMCMQIRNLYPDVSI